MDTDYAKEGWKTRYQRRVSGTERERERGRGVAGGNAGGRINDGGSETEGKREGKTRKTKVEIRAQGGKRGGGKEGERGERRTKACGIARFRSIVGKRIELNARRRWVSAEWFGWN